MTMKFVKNNARNCWVAIPFNGYRVTVAKGPEKVIYFEIEKRMEGFYKTIHYELLDLCEIIVNGFSMDDIKSPFIRELKKVANKKIFEDKKNGR